MVIRFLIEKEFKQMVRNVILPIVFVMLPLGMINVMPKAATQEVKNLKISVVDNDHSSLSERLVHNLSASAYFHLADYSPSYDSALHRVEAGDADFIIEIEPDFERNLMREGVSRVMISANAVNGVKAGLGRLLPTIRRSFARRWGLMLRRYVLQSSMCRHATFIMPSSTTRLSWCPG